MDRQCLNCKTILTDIYCPHCGQDSRKLIISFRELFHELIEKTLGVDGRLGLTLRTLFTAPGKISVDYVNGKRQRYISPVKFYISVSVFFFFLLTQVSGVHIDVSPFGLDIETNRSGISTLTSSLGPSPFDPIIANINASPMESRSALLMRGIFTHAGQALLLLVPVVAGFLAILFRRRPFYEHLILALHFSIFTFLVLPIGVIPWPGSIHASINNLLSIVLFIYAFLVLFRFYGESILLTLVKLSVVGVLSVASIVASFYIGLRLHV